MKRFASIIIFGAILVSLHGTLAVRFLISLRTGESWDLSRESTLFHERQMTESWPVSLPYQPDQKDFLPAKGSFERNNLHYKILKQRYSRDTLHILYTIDVQKNRLDFLFKKLLKGQTVLGGFGHGLFSCLKILPGPFVISEFLHTPGTLPDSVVAIFPDVLLLFKSHLPETAAPPPKS